MTGLSGCKVIVFVRGDISEHGNKTIRADKLCRSVKFNQTITRTKKKVAEVPTSLPTVLGLRVATQKPDSMISDYYKQKRCLAA